jgi:hypothetical protein
VWDDDDWWINYIAHPYWGGTYYVRGRERGLDRGRSFLFSATLAALFEYTVEAFFEPVSLNDLIVSPVLGSLVGDHLFMPLRQKIREKPGPPTWSDKALLVLIDPLGVVSAWTDRTFGVVSEVSLRPLGTTTAQVQRRERYGFGAEQSAPVTNARHVWGLHVRATSRV